MNKNPNDFCPLKTKGKGEAISWKQKTKENGQILNDIFLIKTASILTLETLFP